MSNFLKHHSRFSILFAAPATNAVPARRTLTWGQVSPSVNRRTLFSSTVAEGEKSFSSSLSTPCVVGMQSVRRVTATGSSFLTSPPSLQLHSPSRSSSSSRSSSASKVHLSVLSKTQLMDTIIFDLNGTLVDNSRLVRDWAAVIEQQFLQFGSSKQLQQLFASLRYDPIKKRANGDGMLAMRPWQEIYDAVAFALGRATGMRYAEASARVSEWRGHVDHCSGHDPLFPLEPYFEGLRASGIRKFALSTADDRNIAISVLEEHNVASYFDVVVAGTDAISPKPQPDNARYILKSLQRSPNRTMIVGDTKSDMLLARNANAGLGVGVRSGLGTEDQIQLYADVCISSAEAVGHLLRGCIPADAISVIEDLDDESTPTVASSFILPAASEPQVTPSTVNQSPEIPPLGPKTSPPPTHINAAP